MEYKNMKRVKSKAKSKHADEDATDEEIHTIFGKLSTIPKKYLRMKVNDGTKLRNVLGYALNEFTKFDSNVLWTGSGKGGINKAITCAEIFKRKNPGLYQLTKLRFINKNKKDQLESNKIQQVPEINILLSKNDLQIKPETE